MVKKPATNLATSSKGKGGPSNTKEIVSIDDIFAAPIPKKRKADVVEGEISKNDKSKTKIKNYDAPQASTSSLNPTEGENKKKKKKRPQTENVDTQPDKPERVVEEVVDPSSLIEIRKKVEAEKAKMVKSVKVKSGKRDDKDVEDDELFADSRGEGPRRKTEEGFLIYKEAELQIDPTAGGTPLCPFDCECCF
ncbi:uncharacterized protein IL334_005270 [Kwoniella shivajii]|uniref:DUF1764 domain-containing protein n=1 Tax=Kwoniella shivajii TaxID=564305 RepID=A0ABZ1D456_9TREE|nr:hypothetical protein IL334_005270 [Kwoniella shivajii]